MLSEAFTSVGGGSTFSPIDCAAGQIAVGIHGRAGNQIDAFGLICAPVTGFTLAVGVGIAPQFGPVVNSLAAGSADAESPFELQCPTGYVLTGLAGTAGSSINDLQGRCTPMSPAIPFFVGPVGTTDWFAMQQTASCPDGTVAIGFQGRASATIDELQLRCR